jgi:protein O-mannosyl-transferase
MKLTFLNNRPEISKSRFSILGLLALVFFGSIIYSHILNAPFIFDDFSSIVDSEIIKHFATTLKKYSNNRYVTLLSFAFNYALGGLKPFGYHLLNNLIHIINALLVYYLVTVTFDTPFFRSYTHNESFRISRYFMAFSSAFVFITHPIQTQAVTYIAQRAASMATLFYLISLLMYIQWRLIINQEAGGEEKVLEIQNRRLKLVAPAYILYAISFISAVLAMKTKEIAFTLPVIITLYEFYFFCNPSFTMKANVKRKRFLYLFPLLLTMLIIPLSMLNINVPVETILENADKFSKETPAIDRTDYLFTQFRVLVTYLRLLVFPVNQSLDYRFSVSHSFFNIQVLLSFLFLSVITTVAVYLFYRSKIENKNIKCSGDQYAAPHFRLISFGILWFFITLSVESSIIPIRDVIVEHRLYLPSIGFFIACISLADCIIHQMKTKVILVTLIVLLLAVSTYYRNTLWQDPQKLWEDVIEKAPNNVRAYNELGAIFRDEEKYTAAMEQFEKALQINRNYAFTYYNIGYIYYKLGNYENALIYFRKTLECELTPQLHMDIYNSIGMTYSEMGNDTDAVHAFKKAVEILRGSVIPYNNLGRQYMKMGKFDDAIEIFEKGLRIREDPHLRSNLSLAFAKKKERDKNLKNID